MLSFPGLAALTIIVLLTPAIEYLGVVPRAASLPTTRRWILDMLCSLVGYGGWLAVTGSMPVADLMTPVLMIVTTVASNIKYKVLGEPLLFSDLVVARSFLQHPKFYLFSIPVAARLGLIVLATAPPILLWIYASSVFLPHLLGGGMLLLGYIALRICPAQSWAPEPDMVRDLARLGLPGSMIIYWRRWRASPDLPSPTPLRGQAAYDRIIIVQCESFADPVTLGLPVSIDVPAMPGLTRARLLASHQGPLCVSGFGAYTMRSEYGVLFGQDEEELGFRQYDPFLTARHERAHALPQRLKALGYESTFVHPHDLRFYDRKTLMPAMGFDHVISPGPHTPTDDMPYFGDIALGEMLGNMTRTTSTPSLIYTVTMENHGPWPTGSDSYASLRHYLRHLAHSDEMLLNLMNELSDQEQRSLLVFFGDHRPSIPGIIMPGTVRDVPYTVVSFPLTEHTAPAPSISRTPAQLNALITALSDQTQTTSPDGTAYPH
ncbi:capsule polysaccharide biosynthesis protein [Komagataeibacter europaeus NBRC 3261]|uniref:Capsule polysaccharide biosynthesis protein n=1 Tax=Komagataeibacter europaeus NBRC 3261 TaxID=1234669 RepID=A0A0D6Q3F5_KOMEU|nr:LTA synthase family protein [Komagataeibacter europaeus]GAN97281.1 capsule polysaccharide biosynthesis protein [Komagataeibacter europaeus NBRC 3261]